MAKAKRADLIKAAKDICTVCELEDSKGGPAIKTTKSIKDAAIIKGIKEASGFMEEWDLGELSDSTLKVMKGLDCVPTFDEEEEIEEEETEEEGEEEEEEEEEEIEEEIEEEETEEEGEEEEEEEEEELDLADTLINTKKLVDLKALVKEHKEFKKLKKGLDKFKGLSGPRELKPLMLKALGIEEKKEDKKAAKPKGKAKGSPIVSKSADKTRYGACGLALLALKGEVVSNDDIAKKADEIYGEVSGADENLKQSKRVWSRFVPFCIVTKLLKEEGKGKFKVK